MKKLAFILLFVIPMMVFSCGSDSANTTESSPKILTDNVRIPSAVAQDSTRTALDRTSSVIDANIEALNKAEVDLVKEFDLK